MSDAHIFELSNRAEEATAVRADLTAGKRITALYEAHRDELYRFLVGQGIEPATAQELAQDVFVKLLLAIRKDTEIESEQAWLFGVAAKLAVDYWRREGRPMWVELESFPELAHTLKSCDLSPEAYAVREQRLQRVAKMLARLPKEQRLGINLRMKGLRYHAIAKILGVSKSTAAELVSIAVKRLRSTANE
jgi:RNA polymerase sigma factor (sigma-70 family)